jgi:hypothetical protein
MGCLGTLAGLYAPALNPPHMRAVRFPGRKKGLLKTGSFFTCQPGAGTEPGKRTFSLGPSPGGNHGRAEDEATKSFQPGFPK